MAMSPPSRISASRASSRLASRFSDTASVAPSCRSVRHWLASSPRARIVTSGYAVVHGCHDVLGGLEIVERNDDETRVGNTDGTQHVRTPRIAEENRMPAACSRSTSVESSSIATYGLPASVRISPIRRPTRPNPARTTGALGGSSRISSARTSSRRRQPPRKVGERRCRQHAEHDHDEQLLEQRVVDHLGLEGVGKEHQAEFAALRE